MKIVVDTNIILSALIKNSLTREILKNVLFEFFTPDFSIGEITKYKNYVCKKASISEKDFDILLESIFEKIKIVPSGFYEEHLNYSKPFLTDIGDVPFLACAIALDANIWSDDKHFKQQKKVGVFTTGDFAKKFFKRQK